MNHRIRVNGILFEAVESNPDDDKRSVQNLKKYADKVVDLNKKSADTVADIIVDLITKLETVSGYKTFQLDRAIKAINASRPNN